MNKKFSLKTFLRKYPNDDACLNEIFNKRFPDGVHCVKCDKITKYYKLAGRTAYSCEFCRTQIFPLVGTIFEKSSVSLRLWFYAMFLMTKTRSGISAKQLERELGVCYKTAHRMFKQIRFLMEEEPSLLEGTVEVDETFMGGKGKNRAYQWRGDKPKEIVMGLLERKGTAILKHIPNTGKYTLLGNVAKYVDPTAKVLTDEYAGYTGLSKLGFVHESVNHGKSEYVRLDVHTNNIEGVWSLVKRGIYGVYRHVSAEYLQDYINEYSWRYNNRHLGEGMFEALLNHASLKVLKPSSTTR